MKRQSLVCIANIAQVMTPWRVFSSFVSIGRFYRWHPQRPFYVLRLVILNQVNIGIASLTGRLYCTPKALLEHSVGSNCICGYDPDLMGRTKSMKRR